MKVPISECALIDLDAPVVPVYEVRIKVGFYLVICCKYCRQWHRHGATKGHREAHCDDRRSPYWKSGYNLVYAGEWKPE